MDSCSCRESSRLAAFSTERVNNSSSASPPIGSSAFPGDRGQGQAHADWAGWSAAPAGRGAHPLSLQDGRAAARSGQAGAACGESRTGSGGTSGLHAARGDSVWTNATRGRFAQRASPRGRLGLSGRGRGKAPRAAKTPSTPLPQRGAKPAPRHLLGREAAALPPRSAAGCCRGAWRARPQSRGPER